MPPVLSCSLRSCLPRLKKNRLVKITTKKQEACVAVDVVISPHIVALMGCVEASSFIFIFHVLDSLPVQPCQQLGSVGETVSRMKCPAAGGVPTVNKQFSKWLQVCSLFIQRAPKNPLWNFLSSVPHSELQQ